jgi:5'-deoxynucleotidase YfbR-like HD superfamily hydrolase
MFERELRELEFVPRWGICRTLKQQSVASHSFYVALYAGQVAMLVKWLGDRGALLDYALRHDLEEVFMSDVPGPVKRATQDEKKMQEFVEEELYRRFGMDWRTHGVVPDKWPEIKYIVKVADLLDEVFYLASEQQMGNKAVSNVLEHSYERLRKAWHALCDLLNVSHSIRLQGVDWFEVAFRSHATSQSIIVEG